MNIKLSFLAIILVLLNGGCASKKIDIKENKKKETIFIKGNTNQNIINPFTEHEEKFYEDAKLATVWVATYKTKDNIRVRSGFIDIWLKKAQFTNTEEIPKVSN